jgi:uncharacterized protein YndB with AHSA1/START domain
MREISRELPLAIPPAAAFSLLHTAGAIREWWSASRAIVAARPRGLWVAAWGSDEDDPEYVTAARILVWEPPTRLRLGEFEYYTRAGAGMPFMASLETEFTVQAASGGSLLRVRQTGFPDASIADEFYAACQAGWETTFGGIERFVARRSGAGGERR